MSKKNYGNDSQIAEIVKYISDTMKFPVMGAGGGFAPIGAEAYFDGQVAPLGWVICDGTELNIADYPDLATYYASQHGASNYYGGDGVTTFAVPTRSGMPTNVDEVFTITEHIVGTYTDGRPIYKKVYPFTYTGETEILLSDIIGVEKSQTTYFQADWHSLITNDNGASNEYFFSASDYYNWYYAPSTKKVRFRSGGDWPKKPVDMLFICNYTKSADSPVLSGHSSDGNGVFCVKATVAGDPNGHVYSTEEQVVGQWIDGRPVYERVYRNVNLETSFNQNVGAGEATLTDSSLANIDVLIDCRFIGEQLKNSGITVCNSVNAQHRTSNTLFIRTPSDNNYIQHIIIQYTKTQS